MGYASIPISRMDSMDDEDHKHDHRVFEVYCSSVASFVFRKIAAENGRFPPSKSSHTGEEERPLRDSRLIQHIAHTIAPISYHDEQTMPPKQIAHMIAAAHYVPKVSAH